jgi:hypothetical protein
MGDSNGFSDDISIDIGDAQPPEPFNNDNNLNQDPSQPIINNWTKENTQVLVNWKRTLVRLGFMCQYAMDTNKKILNVLQLLALLFSSASTLISAVSSTILSVNDNTGYQMTGMILSVIICTFGCIVSTLSAIIKLFNLSQNVENYASYISKIDQLYATINSELILPPPLRVDANSFIQKENQAFTSLISQCPNMNYIIHKRASNKYKKFVNEKNVSFICSQKYHGFQN